MYIFIKCWKIRRSFWEGRNVHPWRWIFNPTPPLHISRDEIVSVVYRYVYVVPGVLRFRAEPRGTCSYTHLLQLGAITVPCHNATVGRKCATCYDLVTSRYDKVTGQNSQLNQHFRHSGTTVQVYMLRSGNIAIFVTCWFYSVLVLACCLLYPLAWHRSVSRSTYTNGGQSCTSQGPTDSGSQRTS